MADPATASGDAVAAVAKAVSWGEVYWTFYEPEEEDDEPEQQPQSAQPLPLRPENGDEEENDEEVEAELFRLEERASLRRIRRSVILTAGALGHMSSTPALGRSSLWQRRQTQMRAGGSP